MDAGPLVQMIPINIFIGWDSKQQEASDVCEYSILKHVSDPSAVKIHHLKKDKLIDDGIYFDTNRPASTEFSYTRFLVPFLCDYKGLALFIDSDFVFTHDIGQLFERITQRDKKGMNSVHVCKHDEYVPANDTKFYGNAQEALPRKNWSSMMLFNCEHADCKKLNPLSVSNRSAKWLHRFEWTSDNHLGNIPKLWNWLVGDLYYNEDTSPMPWGIHYTNGGPFNDVYGQDLEHIWLQYKNEMGLKNE